MTCGQRRTGEFSMRRVSSFRDIKRRSNLKASMRKKVQELLAQAGKGKTAKTLTEKFEQTGTLSKRDLKILMRLVDDRARHVA
jgi:uncharacterized coiled-coil DUF342 family protein